MPRTFLGSLSRPVPVAPLAVPADRWQLGAVMPPVRPPHPRCCHPSAVTPPMLASVGQRSSIWLAGWRAWASSMGPSFQLWACHDWRSHQPWTLAHTQWWASCEAPAPGAWAMHSMPSVCPLTRCNDLSQLLCGTCSAAAVDKQAQDLQPGARAHRATDKVE
jgi:hypothetical protein